MTLAAAGDTWGIPGPTFLAFFFGALLVISVLAALHRYVLFAGRTGADVSSLGPQQVAYLGGGDKIAVYTAIAGLRAAGAIGSDADRTLQPTGPLPGGVTPLDTAVYHAAGRRMRSRDVASEQWVGAALEQLRSGLESAGLATTAAQRSIARLWAVPAGILVGVGVLRIIAGWRNDRPVGFLVPLTAFALILTFTLVAKSRTTRTRAATKAIAELRRQHAYLAPREAPSYATYGASGAAMGVALFGAASLYAMDPAFAAEAEIQRIGAGGTTSGFSGGDGSYGGGDGGGGSCGGGSSCGGGGGCGGGGCGG
jgi:uncharacterized protein (TIGR04222 family)